VNDNTKGMLIVSAWIIYVFIWFFNAESISLTIASSGIIVGVLLYLLGNPAYILLIYGVFNYGKKKGRMIWKRVVASLLIVLGLDMVTLPRLSFTDPLTNGIATTTNIGSILMRWIESSFVPHSAAFISVYIILPIIFIAIALELLGVSDFIREVKSR